MSAEVVALHPGAGDVAAAADRALSTLHHHLDRCKLSANTVKAYKRQAAAYVRWLAAPEPGTTTPSPTSSAPRRR
ncbi:hypothetical protein ACFQYP_19570 [Nonomuraea antimicrobica]